MEASSLQTLLAARGLRLIDLASRVDVDKATVTRWAQKRIPAERVLGIEAATGIPRSELRPDLYADPIASCPHCGKARSDASGCADGMCPLREAAETTKAAA